MEQGYTRFAVDDDIPQLQQIFSEHSTDQYAREKPIELLEQKGDTQYPFTYVVSGDVVGIMSIEICEGGTLTDSIKCRTELSFPASKYGVINSGYILNKYRGRGIGSELLESCIKCAKHQGCTSVLAEVFSKTGEKYDSREMLEKYGFTQIFYHPEYYKEYFTTEIKEECLGCGNMINECICDGYVYKKEV